MTEAAWDALSKPKQYKAVNNVLLKGANRKWHSTRDVFVREQLGWVVSDDLRAALAVEEQAMALDSIKQQAKASNTGRMILAHTPPLAQVMPARPDFLPELGAPALTSSRLPAEESSEAADVIQQMVDMIEECVGQLM